MEKNTELAYRALDYIREHPENWDQYFYFCGTTMCYGGTAITLAGATDRIPYDETQKIGFHGHMAARLLGWTEKEAAHVFLCFTDDFDVLERRVKEVLNGEIGG